MSDSGAKDLMIADSSVGTDGVSLGTLLGNPQVRKVIATCARENEHVARSHCLPVVEPTAGPTDEGMTGASGCAVMAALPAGRRAGPAAGMRAASRRPAGVLKPTAGLVRWCALGRFPASSSVRATTRTRSSSVFK
jgi:hypothetical protein